MNCTELRERLPELLYGELTPEAASVVEQHVANCEACRAEYQALHRLRQRLDAVPAPKVQVDVPRLFRQAADVQEQRVRRWRRLTLAAGGLAAAVFLVLILRLEVRVDAHQVVLTWNSTAAGVPSSSAAPATKPVEPVAEDLELAVLGRELRLAKELIHALARDLESRPDARDVDARDRRLRREIDRLTNRLQEFEKETASQRAVTARYLDALYVAYFGPKEKGAKQ